MQKVAIFSLCFLLSACVVPPKQISTSLLTSEELAIVSSTKRGVEYSSSGRDDLAELYFREALAVNPRLEKVHNDLGYALLNQQRYNEAILAFKKSLEIVPGDYTASDNIARTYYRAGRYSEAKQEYLKIIDNFFRNSSKNERSNVEVDPAKFVVVFRNLSIIYYAEGELGEATCYAKLAMDYASKLPPSQYYLNAILAYERLLLAIEKPSIAIKILEKSIVDGTGASSGKIFLDYGIALYAKGRLNEANKSFLIVPVLSGSNSNERMFSQIIQLMIAHQVEKDQNKLSLFTETFTKNYPDFCSENYLNPDNYFPTALESDLTNFKSKLCTNGEKSSFF